jgi:hypothetical protein
MVRHQSQQRTSFLHLERHAGGLLGRATSARQSGVSDMLLNLARLLRHYSRTSGCTPVRRMLTGISAAFLYLLHNSSSFCI